jgi:outer membrane beta-barrel protein
MKLSARAVGPMKYIFKTMSVHFVLRRTVAARRLTFLRFNSFPNISLKTLQFSTLLIFVFISTKTLAADEFSDEATDRAAAIYDVPEIAAVQKRLYVVNYELTPKIGIFPLDAFNKSLVLGLSYSWYFGERWAWEVFDAFYAKNLDTSLKQTILDQFGAQTLNQAQGVLDYIQWMLTTNLVYTPVYSKSLYQNRSLLYNETSAVMGLGAVGFRSGDVALAFGGGVQWRLFFSKNISFKTDTRLYYHLGQNKNTNLLLQFNTGLSIHFGGEK